MIEIIPEIMKTGYCVLSCIKCYLHHLGVPHEAMLLCNWSMGPIIDNEITLPYSISPLDMLTYSTGTQIQIIEKEHVQMDVIYREITHNKPIISYVDSFECSWMTYYRRIHADHYILLIGCDEKLFYALDPYLTASVNTIDQSILNNGLSINNMGNHFIERSNEKLFVFSKIDNKENNTVGLVSFIAERYCDIYHNYMIELCNFFGDTTTIFHLLNEEDIVHNKFYFDIKAIVDSRNDFFKGLRYLCNKFGRKFINLDIISEFEEIANLWKRLLSCLYRFAYSKHDDKRIAIITRANNYLNCLTELEYDFAKKIMWR